VALVAGVMVAFATVLIPLQVLQILVLVVVAQQQTTQMAQTAVLVSSSFATRRRSLPHSPLG